MTLQHVGWSRSAVRAILRGRGAGLQFTEQPRVLDRDDRLVGKGAHQFDLPLGERLDPFPREIRSCRSRLALAQQRHPKRRCVPPSRDSCLAVDA